MTKDIPVPKPGDCDELVDAVLDIVIEQNEVCNALVKKKITKDEVVLSFDDSKCNKA